jgi:hypothetical protein
MIKIILLLLIIFFLFNTQELFINQIWWNATRRTRNMSYDLRGDPIIIPKKQYIWFNNYFF